MTQTHHEKRMMELLQGGFHESVIAFYDRCISEVGTELHILDLAAGSGLVTSSLSGKNYTEKIVAYDRNMECMRQLHAHKKISKCVDGNINQLPFEANQFDVVICRYAFHHFEHKSETLREIGRVLKDSGLFLYSDPVLPEHSKNIMNPLYHIREDSFHGYLGYFETIELFDKNGFQVLLSRPYKYRYSNFQQFLEGVENGFLKKPQEGVVECLKLKIENSWRQLDPKTKTEMGINAEDKLLGPTYNLVDFATVKKEK
jgi:ubiquinone/menaquinone biosynthesis C-methylase UbiE